MKYLIYLRVSKKEQDEIAQLDQCLKFIKQMNTTEFEYEVFRDKITSKKPLFKMKKKGDAEITLIPRPGAKEMMEKIRKGDVIVSMRIDRLARSSYETSIFIKKLEEIEAEVMLVTQPGIKNKVLLGVYAGMAEEEVKTLRARVKEKLDSKRMRGERYCGFLPYGYGLHETKLVPIRDGDEIVMKRGILIPIHEEQKVLKHIGFLASEGLNCSQVTKEINHLGYKNREGKPFQTMTIHRILSRIQDPIQEKVLQESLG